MVLSKAVVNFQRIMGTRNMAVSATPQKSSDWRYFTLSGMKKNYAVIPLVVIMTGAVIGLAGFIVYATQTRTDISFNRKNGTIADNMDMMNPEKKKIVVFNQQYRPMPELSEALKASKKE